MEPYLNNKACYEQALTLAQDRALWGNDEQLQSVKGMRPESLTADDLRKIRAIVTTRG